MSRTRLPLAALSLASVSALLLAGCSQSTNASKNTGDPAAAASAATGKKPAPFDKGTVKVALVRQSGAGDYFEQWGNGAKAQAKALGIDLTVYDAQADNAKQATNLSSAINSGAQAIIVDHGFPATIQPELDKAVKKGVKVVVYDVETATKGVVSTKQDDASMAQAVLDVMAKNLGKNAKVGYVNVAGYAALDKRDSVWKSTVKANSWKQALQGRQGHRLHGHGQCAAGLRRAHPALRRDGRLRPLRRAGEGHRPRRAEQEAAGQGEGVRRGRLQRRHPEHDRPRTARGSPRPAPTRPPSAQRSSVRPPWSWPAN